MTVRLIGINTPESGECWSEEATSALTDLVGTGPVWLTTDRSDVDQYGRALRYVVNADLQDVGGLLVEQGAAIARSYPPDTANDDRYALLQEAARLAGRGLWAADACGSGPLPNDAPPTTVDIDVHPDAEGDDNTNLNDEWVRFTNAGTAPLDFNGWIVGDESSSHRYTFTDLVVDPGAAVTLSTGCGIDTAVAALLVQCRLRGVEQRWRHGVPARPGRQHRRLSRLLAPRSGTTIRRPAAESRPQKLRRPLPDRDVRRALAGERLAVPVAPAFAQRHPGDAGHQVELRRPHVAERHREDVELVVDDASSGGSTWSGRRGRCTRRTRHTSG